MSILWTIIIGFVAGIVAKFLMPGPNEPSGFILTTILGIVGAFVASWLGQSLGLYGPGEGAGFIGAIGRLFGDSGINIASLNLGRSAPGADAICLIAIDTPPSQPSPCPSPGPRASPGSVGLREPRSVRAASGADATTVSALEGRRGRKGSAETCSLRGVAASRLGGSSSPSPGASDEDGSSEASEARESGRRTRRARRRLGAESMEGWHVVDAGHWSGSKLPF